MLIRFQITNFLSFHDTVEFSMIPGKTRSHTNHIVRGNGRTEFDLLRAGIIYGANASGKSNLVKALSFAQRFITGEIDPKPKGRIPFRQHFKLDKTCSNEPSKFAFEIKTEDQNYIYGFEVTSKQIISEWLYTIRRGREPRCLFEREVNQDGISVFDSPYRNNHPEKERLKFIEQNTLKNQLFVTKTINENVSDFEPIFGWFKNTLTILFPHTRPQGLEVAIEQNEELKQRILKLLTTFDLDINDLLLDKVDLQIALPDVPTYIKEELIQNVDPETKTLIALSTGDSFVLQINEQDEVEALKLMTVHKMADGSKAIFELDEESDGTRRAFELIPALLSLIYSNKVMVIDELDRSLHPHLSRKFLELFFAQGSNEPSQLIVTTHESSLLDFDLLRRDEIWFVEKDERGHSDIYSLEEFSPRYDKDIRKGYLFGRFGAIPNLHTPVSTWLDKKSNGS